MSTTNPTWTTTEWEDILIKKGIIEAPDIDVTEVELNKAAQDVAELLKPIYDKSKEDLDEIAECEDGSDDDLETLRKKRMQEIRQFAKIAKYGSLYHITKTNFVKEVTDASKEATVICHLYTESKAECQVINEFLGQLSHIHKSVKFSKAIATDVMENFPESRCPCLLIYKNGECANQIIGAEPFQDYKRKYSAAALEWVLVDLKVLAEVTLSESDPRQPPGATKKDVFGYSAAKLFGAREKTDYEEDVSDDDEKDDREYQSFGRLGAKAKKADYY